MSYQLPGEKKAIEKWDTLPGNINFVLREGDEVGDDGGCALGGTWVNKSSAELFANKKVVIFGLPGAFTPTCSSEQLPTFEKMYDEFKAQGVDEVHCISVNDAFVMNAWAKELGCTKVKLLADGNADFTHAVGMLCNKRNKGFANRSWRYAMYVDNMTVNESFIEPGYNNEGSDDDPYVESTPENVIQYIETLNR